MCGFVSVFLYCVLINCFLNGITRKTIINLAREFGIKTIERTVELKDMEDAEECFLTGTAAEVTPVGKIAEFEFKPGNLCKEILGSYSELVRA